MSDEDKPKSFEETLRAIADEVTRGIQQRPAGRSRGRGARPTASTPTAPRRSWTTPATGCAPRPTTSTRRRRSPSRAESRVRAAPGHVAGTTRCAAPGPDPLDTPTDDQGRALAALDSGRWTVEPGTSALSASGGGPGPSDALGLVRELRVRDWIDADGEVTLVGHAALQRWLDATDRG